MASPSSKSEACARQSWIMRHRPFMNYMNGVRWKNCQHSEHIQRAGKSTSANLAHFWICLQGFKQFGRHHLCIPLSKCIQDVCTLQRMVNRRKLHKIPLGPMNLVASHINTSAFLVPTWKWQKCPFSFARKWDFKCPNPKTEKKISPQYPHNMADKRCFMQFNHFWMRLRVRRILNLHILASFFLNGGQVRNIPENLFIFCTKVLHTCWFKTQKEAMRFWFFFEISVHPCTGFNKNT